MLFAVLLTGCVEPAAVKLADVVEIETRWGGLGPPIAEKFVFHRVGDAYLSGNERADGAAIADLVKSVTEVPVGASDGLRELASPTWLKGHVEKGYRTLTDAQGQCSPDARRLFIDRFTDSETAIRALMRHYGTRHTDDFPYMMVRIRSRDGHVFTAVSSSQHALMLPWKTAQGVTWNAGISRALARALPTRSQLRARLVDDELASALASEVGESIRDRWEELEERCLYSAITGQIEKRFRIETIYHAWPGQFAGHLRRSDLPRNLLIDVHISADRPHGAQEFLDRVEAYISRARRFVEAHPSTVFELEYFDGTSLREDGLQLHQISEPNDKNIQQVEKVLGDCVSLRDHGDPNAHRIWVVLPSGEGIEWNQ